MADLAVLEERISRIEAPALAAERQRELSRLRSEAEAAQRDLVRIGAELADLGAQRRALAPKITAAEAEWARLRLEDARLAVAETALQRQHGLAWDSIHRAELAARPVPVAASERRPSTVADIKDAVLAWFRRLRDRHPLPTPAMRPDQFLAARVRLLQSCVCAGAGHQAGEVLLVPDHEADILLGNGRCVVLERRIVADRQMPAVAMARAVRGTRGPNGEALAAGDVVPVDAPTRNAIVSGKLSSLELIGEDVEIEKRIAAMQAKVAELAVRFPQGAGA
jgi:hypothetical protein